MKIVCDSCGAKYSIADEKVAGKVFKIRCKKCSAVIVVKGDSQDDGDEATRVYDYSAEAVWHVVVGGEQQGPLAPRQLGELLSEGKIDWEAYVWREGMDGWQPAKDVETLVSAIMADAESAPSPQAERASQAQLFGGSSDMGADPFAGDDGGLSGVMGQSDSHAESGGGDLFARSARSPFAGSAVDDEPHSNEHSSARVSESESLTGQRNENSVLFSLSNLQALATGSPNTAPAPKPKAGMAQGEGSGLIDIRALASATQSMGHSPTNGSSRDKVEDLMAVGAGSVAFSAAALAAPVAVEKSDNNKVMMAGMAAAILLLGAAVGYLGLRDGGSANEPSIAQAAGENAAGTVASAPAAGAVAAAGAAVPTPAPADPAPVRAAANTGDDDESPSARAERQTRSKRSSDSASAKSEKTEKASAPASAPAAAPAPAPAPPKQSSGDKSIDDLLDSALNGKPAKKPATAAPAAAALAPTPSRDDVINAMKGVAPRVQACGNGQTGVATAKIAVAGATGRVTSVDVSGQFAGTPVASCVVKEVGKAKFPKFSNSSFSVAYPFKI